MIAAGSSKWNKLGYLRRSLSDVPNAVWNNPKYLVTTQSEDSACSLGSPVFSANRKNFICSNSTAKVPAGGSCKLPYGLVYGVVKSNVAPAAIYSHTVVFGSGLCSNFEKLNYYVQLSSYLSWGAKVAGYKMKIVYDSDNTSSTNEKKMPTNSTYTMEIDASVVPGVAVYGGNLFTLVKQPKPTSTGIPPVPTGSPTDSDNTSQPTNGPTITITATRTVTITRSSTATSGAATTLVIGTNPTSSKSRKHTKTHENTIPNISVVTKLPIQTNSPTGPTSPTTTTTTTNTTNTTNTTTTTSTDTDTGTDTGTGTGNTDQTTSSTDSSTDQADNNTEGMSSKTKILIGVFVGLAVLGIGAFCLYYFYYRRR
ncbi:hypothetical protein IWW38_005158 [Coemansia aciculifera]|uniref:Uncharacterized protein n=1 Tax=Coemansia aciculifera TaxID=417176 RepID=A0ACC1LVJ2_9FUNG|nr:hypothetical protein IWW38_005158 [Coemansia aciculifera]